MPLPTRQPTRRAITASATRLDKKESEYAKRLQQPEQLRALYYYDRVGEIRYGSRFYARMLGRVRLFPAILEDNGSKTPIEGGPPVDLLNRIQDPGGGRAQIQRDYGRLMFITGEGVLFGSNLDTGDERWRFLWREEVKIRDDGTAVKLNVQKQETKEVGVAYRMWTPHPKHSDTADAPMLGVLDIAEELLLLTASVRGSTVSRMTNGILKMPAELSPDPADPGSDEDPNQNVFLAAYIEHVQAQIEDPGAAAAKVPFLLEGAFEYLSGMDWLKTHDPATDYMERDMRTEAIDRLALSLDFPPEELKGMTDANHWTAQQVTRDKWQAHGQPVAQQMATDFAQAYLRPALRDDDYQGWEKVVIDIDDSQVVTSPDRTAIADNAADRGMIGDKGYRKLAGIDESMAPTKDEKELWAAIKSRDIPAIDDALGIVNERGPTPALPSGNGNQPSTPPEPTQGRSGSRQEARTASIVGAAQLALRQCRARAGARLRTQLADKCPECRERTADLPHSLVASALGKDQLDLLGVKNLAGLVAGGTDEFRGILTEWGIPDADAQGLCSRVEFYAAKSLLEERQPELPPGFVAQVEQATEMMEAENAA